VFLVVVLSVLSVSVQAVPTGPTIATSSNTTKVSANGSIDNGTGGRIYTVVLTSEEQNNRWKGYVGNVTGTLVLD